MHLLPGELRRRGNDVRHEMEHGSHLVGYRVEQTPGKPPSFVRRLARGRLDLAHRNMFGNSGSPALCGSVVRVFAAGVSLPTACWDGSCAVSGE